MSGTSNSAWYRIVHFQREQAPAVPEDTGIAGRVVCLVMALFLRHPEIKKRAGGWERGACTPRYRTNFELLSDEWDPVTGLSTYALPNWRVVHYVYALLLLFRIP